MVNIEEIIIECWHKGLKKMCSLRKKFRTFRFFFSLAFNLFSHSELALVHSPNCSTKDSAGYCTLPYFLAEVPPMLINLWATGVTTRFGSLLCKFIYLYQCTMIAIPKLSISKRISCDNYKTPDWEKRILSFKANFSFFSLAEGLPRDLQITAYK